jgi:hypothetical protein
MMGASKAAWITTQRITAHISSTSTASSSFPAIATSRSRFPTPFPFQKESASSEGWNALTTSISPGSSPRMSWRINGGDISLSVAWRKGSNMMSESLAEYSALRVMQQKYGDEHMRRFLKHELDGYLRGRAGEVRHEPPLVLVQNEPYVWYQKGSMAFYALSDAIGEDKLNLALKEFLDKWKMNGPPYPDTRGLVEAAQADSAGAAIHDHGSL